MSFPTILFVPGAWHGIEAFTLIREVMLTLGYPTSAVHLPSVGSSHATVGVPEDSAAIREELQKLISEGKDVAVVTHSYGGIPGSNALEGLNKRDRVKRGEQGGVLKIIYLASSCIPAGTSLLEGLGGTPFDWWDIKNGFVTPKNPIEMFYHDVEPGLAAKVAATLLPVAQEIMHGKCEFEPWNQGFNVSYIFTQEDSTLPFEVQQAMASQFPEGSFTISLLTSHSPFLSAPKELGNAIQACIKYTGKV